MKNTLCSCSNWEWFRRMSNQNGTLLHFFFFSRKPVQTIFRSSLALYTILLCTDWHWNTLHTSTHHRLLALEKPSIVLPLSHIILNFLAIICSNYHRKLSSKFSSADGNKKELFEIVLVIFSTFNATLLDFFYSCF